MPCGQLSDEHGERVALLVGPLLLGEPAVAAACEHLDPGPLVLREVVAQLAQLALADAGEGERVEDEGDVLLAAEARERDVVAVLIFEREVGGLFADRDNNTN